MGTKGLGHEKSWYLLYGMLMIQKYIKLFVISDQQKLQSAPNQIKKQSDKWLLRLLTDNCKFICYFVKHLTEVTGQLSDMPTSGFPSHRQDDSRTG